MKIKKNDVFSFRYNEEFSKKIFEPYHCFDGTLVVRETSKGFILKDTYYSSESRYFTLEKALNQGNLIFVCNLDEVEKCQEYDKKYYDDNDFITLYIHGGYRNQYFLKRGSKKSNEKISGGIRKKIQDLNSSIESKKRNIKDLEKNSLN